MANKYYISKYKGYFIAIILLFPIMIIFVMKVYLVRDWLSYYFSFFDWAALLISLILLITYSYYKIHVYNKDVLGMILADLIALEILIIIFVILNINKPLPSF